MSTSTSTSDIRRALLALVVDRLKGEFDDPKVSVRPGRTEYATGRAAFDARRFRVRVFVGEDDDDTAEVLDGLLDPAGIKAVIEADSTLGGAVADVRVVQSSGHELYQSSPGDPPVLGAEWTVEVRTA